MDTTDVFAQMQRIASQLQSSAGQAEETLADQLADQVRANAPVKTGRLRNSIQRTGNTVIVDVDYAALVDANPESDGFGFFSTAPDQIADQALQTAADMLNQEIA